MTFQLLGLEPAIQIIDQPQIAKTAFYQVGKCGNKWQVVKRTSGNACCICRSLDEATQLTIALNQDQQKYPQEHHDSL